MNGILFKDWKIQAIRDNPDREWQTRRLSGLKEINIEPEKWQIVMVGGQAHCWGMIKEDFTVVKPRYRVGEIVYIKEAHYAYGEWHKEEIGWVFHREEDMAVNFDSAIWEHALKGHAGRGWFRRSPLFLPEKDARDFVKIKSVRPERLQEITAYDALQEGINLPVTIGCEGHDFPEGFENYSEAKREDWIQGEARGTYFARCADADNHITAFKQLWDSINPQYPWLGNPWLFRYEFTVVKK